MRTFRVLLAAITLLVVSLSASAQDTSPNATPGGGSQTTAKPSGPANLDAVRDVLTIGFTSADACSLLHDQSEQLSVQNAISDILSDNPLKQWSSSPLATAIGKQCPDCKKEIVAAATAKKSDTAYIFHIVTWDKKANSAAANKKTVTVPFLSEWHVYDLKGSDELRSTGINSSGNPRIYAKKKLLLVGINRFKDPTQSGTVVDAYTSTATRGTPQNVADLAALISALSGISGKSPLGSLTPQATAFECQVIFIAAGLQLGTSGLPFTAKVTSASDDHYASSKPPTTTKADITSSATDCRSESTCVELALSSTIPSVVATISGSFSGTLEFEVSRNSGTFVSATAYQDSTNGTTNATAPGKWSIPTLGIKAVRVRASALTSGSVTVQLDAASISGSSTPKSAADNSNQGKTPAEPSPGVMSCTGDLSSLPCTSSRTFTSLDREWWDVSIGITTPGVRESKYSIVNGALKKNVTTHTDFYGMLDLYPFAWWYEKNDWAPHIDLGVPITSQSLYRPFFGMAESIGGLLTRTFSPKKQITLPFDLSVFGGMVWMKTQIVRGNPTTAAELTTNTSYTRVWKPVFGIEVSVSSVASKIKGATSKSSGTSTNKTSNSGSGET